MSLVMKLNGRLRFRNKKDKKCHSERSAESYNIYNIKFSTALEMTVSLNLKK